MSFKKKIGHYWYLSVFGLFLSKMINLVLNIDGTHCIHQFLVGESSFKFKNQTYNNM
jgi:hypothetical protein